MEFETTPEQEEFRQELRGWLEDHLPDGWSDGERPIPTGGEELEAFLRGWQRELFDGGWAGLAWPEEYGGQNASLIEQVIYEQEMARYDAPPELNSAGLDYVGPTLIEVGTEAQKQRFLQPILTGEEVWCQGYSEPDAGSDLASLQLAAEESGDQFVINGQKIWTSRAHLSDWIFLLTRTDDSGVKHHGITAMMVDMDQAGITVEPIRDMAGEHHFNQLFFDDAVAEKEHVVGEKDDGWGVAMTFSRYERTTSLVFHLERRLSGLISYCRQEERGGEPLIEDEVVRQGLADLETRIRAAKLTYLRNISRQMNTGKPSAEALMDNLYSKEIEQDMAAFAMDLKGPRASFEAYDSATVRTARRLRFDSTAESTGMWTDDYLDSPQRTIAGGTSDIKRNIIAENVLDLPKGLRKE